jgi:Protein kinase domain
MRIVAKKPSLLGLSEGSSVDGFVVETVLERRAGGELLCHAVDPDGAPATLVIALRTPGDRHTATLIREWARVREGLRHQALVPVHAAGEYAERPYMAMDRYPAETFADLLERGPLAPEEVLPQLAPVCDALDLAHGAGLVHQRLSSTSLLLDGNGKLALDAFGIPAGPPRTMLAAVGFYTSPEELKGEPIGPASNVYSMACMIVHALTGSAPFEGSPAAQSYGHLKEAPPRPSRRTPGLTHALDVVIGRGMAKNPRQRHGSARELLAAAAAALGIALPARTVPVPPREAPEPEPEREAPTGSTRVRRGAAIAAVTAILAGLLAGAIIAPFGGDEPAPGPDRDAVALERLDELRTDLRARLASVDTPADQADAAAELAAAYRRVARSAESRPLASAAGAAERAYVALAAAAQAGSTDSYAAASSAVDRAEQELAAVARRR